jgi:type IV pilus assembly protein PilQ
VPESIPAPAAVAKGSEDSVLKLVDIRVKDQVIEIVVDKPLENYRVMKLEKPERLAIDLMQARSAMASKSVNLDVSGVTSARVGAYPDKLRIVLDTATGIFPTYAVEPSATGLYIRLGGTPAAPPVVSADKTLSAKAAPAPETPVAPKAVPAVTSIEYNQLEGSSKLVVMYEGACSVSEPVKTQKTVTFTLRNCSLPKKHQRTLDTSSFSGNVAKVTAYPIKVKGGTDTKFAVTLHKDSPFTFAKSEGIVSLDVPVVERPVAKKAPAPENGAPVAPPSAGLAEASASSSQPAVANGDRKGYTGRRVTLEFSDADVRKIFQLIAEVSNLNFLIGDDVSGTISIKLVNVPWDQALDVILDAKNLGMVRDGNIVLIKPKNKIMSLADEEQAARRSRERVMELRTEAFDVNFATVGDVVSQFNSLKSERGTINPDARTNKVIVKDIQPVLDEMNLLLKTLDIPERQVMIEARIVEATTDFTRELGIQWGFHDDEIAKLGITDLNAGFGGVLTGTAPPVGTFGPGMAAAMTFGRIFGDTLIDLRLSAAAAVGSVKIISTPKVLTLNNKAAKISQGQSIPYTTVSAEGTKTEFVEAALTLEVTPHITPDGTIMMKIKASNNAPGTGSPPPINKKEATTEMLVRNGETTVIGGIYVDTDKEADDGVPFFMDVPLIGKIFKSTSKIKQKTELLIFITPRVVS